ncbi:MAG TPA: hypothetical protein VN812_18240 [Candidatus Acidoferrales bacterium]|nr:hypothetical protein [Candidatus Acidoferrales bacterium]
MSTPLRLDVCIGAIALHRDRLVVVEQRLGPERVRIRDLATGERVNVAIGTLRSRPTLSRGELGEREEMLRTTPKNVWDAGTERERAIRSMLQQEGPLTHRARATAEELKVSERTVFRWLARFLEAEQTTSLIQRRRGRKPGTKLLDVERERLIDAVITDTYLRRPRVGTGTILGVDAPECHNPADCTNVFTRGEMQPERLSLRWRRSSESRIRGASGASGHRARP